MKKIIILFFLIILKDIQGKIYDGCTDFGNACICSNTGNKGRCLPSTGCQLDADNQTCCNCNNEVLNDAEIEKLQKTAFNRFYEKYPTVLKPVKDALDNKKITYWDLPKVQLFLSTPQDYKESYSTPLRPMLLLDRNIAMKDGKLKPEINLAYRTYKEMKEKKPWLFDGSLINPMSGYLYFIHPEAYQIRTKLLNGQYLIQELFPTDEACKGKILNQYCTCANTGKEGLCWVSRQPMPDQPSLTMYCHCD